MGTLLAAVVLAAMAPGLPTQSSRPEHVLELRQYKIVHGQRDAMIDLFERNLVEGQEEIGMNLTGLFRDLSDPDRFTWMRNFPDMTARQRSLTAFYSGPVWQANRGRANPLLWDNDNVLLLRPAGEGRGLSTALSPPPSYGAPLTRSVVVATIHYLWKAPSEGFDAFFLDEMTPAVEAAGLPLLGSYVPEEAPNTFPRLPVRRDEKVFVWFTRADSLEAYEQAIRRLETSPAWRDLQARLHDQEERPAQVLRLAPTSRSRLR